MTNFSVCFPQELEQWADVNLHAILVSYLHNIFPWCDYTLSIINTFCSHIFYQKFLEQWHKKSVFWCGKSNRVVNLAGFSETEIGLIGYGGNCMFECMTDFQLVTLTDDSMWLSELGWLDI